MRRNTDTSPAQTDSRVPLSGLVERVSFHNPDTGFAVLRLRVKGKPGLTTLIGLTPAVTAGEFVQASGNWENSRDHGVQFRARYLQITPPSSLEGMERYLGSGLIKGIGPTYAERLVAAFGEEVFEVIEDQPKRLREVEGIGPKRAKRITSSWAEQRSIREIMVFLQSHGIGTSRAVRIFKTYGADAVPLVSEDPYRLARDIRGIGFKVADQIAAKLGIAKDSPQRARAALSWVLSEATGQGHCALPRERLLETATELLEIPATILEQALVTELDNGDLVADSIGGEPCTFLPSLWQAENSIAIRLRELGRGSPPWTAIDVGRALPWVEEQLGISLPTSQRHALVTILSAKVGVITGGPGVGKTTLVRALLRILLARGVTAALCAPTGRAAKRLAESTGMEAKTIHRLLEAGPRGFRRGPDNLLECDLLIIDETSMVDVTLFDLLLGAVPSHAAILLIGDADQLPSVGPGKVLEDVMSSGVFPVAHLVEIFRQAAQSNIITNAHRVNRGEMPLLQASEGDQAQDFFFVDAASAEDAVDKLVRMVRDRIPRRFGLHPIRDIQVLSPMNRGPLGAKALNLSLQEALNPSTGDASVERFGWSFRPGDKVMQTENDYDKEVFNGDLGSVVRIDLDEQEMEILFDRRRVSYDFGELDQLSLAYATTIHKSQGSEYPAVVIPLTTQHYVMLQRNLLYTGLTRGQRLVVLLGERRALGIAVRGRGQQARWTRLREWLCQ